MILLTSQKNDLFKTIEHSGYFTPNQFEFLEEVYNVSIKFTGSPYFYSIELDRDGDFYIKESPSDNSFHYEYSQQLWMEVMQNFAQWLHNLRRETAEPDLWKRLAENVRFSNLSTNQSDAQFTVSEYEDLKQKMIALSSQMRTLPFLEGKFEEIDSKLAHLVTLGEKLSKFDWANLFLGTLMGILTNIGTSPENSKIVFDLIKKIFTGYFLN